MKNKTQHLFIIIAQIRVPLCSTAIWNSSFTMVAGSTSTAGSTPTLLSSPYDVQFDPYSYMYVADFYNHRIQRFHSGLID